MARIEISLEEYNELKNTIQKLETEIVDKDKIIEELKTINDDIYAELEDIIDSTFLERIFQWTILTESAKEILEKYEQE